MALRVKEIEVGGEKVKIANLQLRPQWDFDEAVKKAADHTALRRAAEDLVVSSLQRADPSFTRERLGQLDGDDLALLLKEITSWTGGGGEKPADPPPSP